MTNDRHDIHIDHRHRRSTQQRHGFRSVRYDYFRHYEPRLHHRNSHHHCNSHHCSHHHHHHHHHRQHQCRDYIPSLCGYLYHCQPPISNISFIRDTMTTQQGVLLRKTCWITTSRRGDCQSRALLPTPSEFHAWDQWACSRHFWSGRCPGHLAVKFRCEKPWLEEVAVQAMQWHPKALDSSGRVREMIKHYDTAQQLKTRAMKKLVDLEQRYPELQGILSDSSGSEKWMRSTAIDHQPSRDLGITKWCLNCAYVNRLITLKQKSKVIKRYASGEL